MSVPMIPDFWVGFICALLVVFLVDRVLPWGGRKP